MEQTPDQIRRATVPVHHTGIAYGVLYGFMGLVIWCGGWAALHQEQVRRYPEYCAHAFHAATQDMSLFGAPRKREPGMSAEALRYALLRYGNVDHRFDLDIIHHGWYPREASAAVWVREYGAVPPVYAEDALYVFAWPLALTSLTVFIACAWGMIADHRYKSKIVAGLPFDGSVIATVAEYNRETRGTGMRYRVAPWGDR